jgi:dihydrolipoamide dehydrogenase
VATGSRPREIPGFAFDGKVVLSSTDALMLEKLPRRLVILGAGAIGMEFAYVMNAFGVEVTLVEMLDTILPLEDPEAVDVVRREFVKRGVKILTGTRAEGLEKKPDGAVVRLSGKDGTKTEVEADQVLVAVGRAPNTDNLGLEALGIRTEKGFIPVGDYGQTTVPNIYAIGDVVATPLLAHVASKEGEIAVERMAGKDPERRIRLDEIPSAVYCEPQVGSFGLSEREAAERGVRFQKAVFPYRGVGKAVAVEAPEGIVKILHDPQTGEILGAHVAGAQATELIHELLLAKKAELTVEDIAGMIHAHPTLSEGVMEAARMAEGWAIHI